MKGIFNVKAMQKTPRELKHSVERYSLIYLKNIEIDGYSMK